MMDTLTAMIIVFGKAAFALSALLGLASITTWIERKGSALIQNRLGANRASILGFDLAGLVNTLIADPVKAITKEDWIPKGVSGLMHGLAVFLAVFPVLLSFAVIPFGPPVSWQGGEISLQVADLNVGLLFVFAMGSLAVYGIVLAGWVSQNKFSLFGALRGSAQMISYEVTMGLSVIGLLTIYQTLDLYQITLAQSGTFYGLPRWGIVLNPIAFLLFFASAMAETKRAPFDLPESESEIVAGYMTEYSGMKFLLFWLGEFSEIVVAAALIALLFLGGWQLPYFDIRDIPADFWGLLPQWFADVGWQWAPLVGAFVFGAKVFFLCVLQVVIRWTLPRFRYDQLMNLCWKIMLSVSILNLVVTAALVLSGFYGESGV
jgi:NADH-quinone oxidoreductase subunit H